MSLPQTNEPEESVRDASFHVELDIPSRHEMINLAVDFCLSLMKLNSYPAEDRDAMRFAVHETLVNAVEHGAKRRPDARIHLRFYIRQSCFFTDIEDEGEGFDPELLPDPTHPENILKPGGRGIFLARSFTDEFSVTRLPHRGVRVTFCRRKRSEDGARSD